MRILFIGCPSADYQADGVFHGLRQLFGTEVVDVERRWHMYKGAPIDPETFYGRGYTLFSLVEEGEVDRTDIEAKIAKRYFDFVIFGSVQRRWQEIWYVREHYGASKVLLIDGEDSPEFHPLLRNNGVYFKRELHSPQSGVFPIQFGIPEEKLQMANRKSKLMAPLIPGKPDTYIYKTEKAYYDDYRSSLFAQTMRKAGWECLRHAEIMASECIPYFHNLEFCPATIMTESPKQEMLQAKLLFDYKFSDGANIFQRDTGREIWTDLNQKIQKVLREKLTTTALAKRILDTALKLA